MELRRGSVSLREKPDVCGTCPDLQQWIMERQLSAAPSWKREARFVKPCLWWYKHPFIIPFQFSSFLLQLNFSTPMSYSQNE